MRRFKRIAYTLVGVSMSILTFVFVGGMVVTELRAFSGMTEEQRAEFQRWYTKKVVIPADALVVREYSTELTQALGTYHGQRTKLGEKGVTLCKEWKEAYLIKTCRALPAEKMPKEPWYVRLAEVEPLFAAFQAVVQRPDYDITVWLPAPDKNKTEAPTVSTILKHYVDLRNTVELGNILIADECKKKNYAKAMEIADTMVQSSRTSAYSGLMDRMVGVAVLKIGMDAWQQILDGMDENPQLRQLATLKLNSYDANKFNHVIPEPPSVQQMDDIATLRYLRRWGVQVNVSEKTAPQLQSEVYFAKAELESQYNQPSPKSNGNEKEVRSADLREWQQQIDVLNGKAWWGRRIVQDRMIRWQMATTYGVAWPGYKKAQEDAQGKIQQFRELQKRAANAAGK